MPYSTLKHLNPFLFALIHLNAHPAALINLTRVMKRNSGSEDRNNAVNAVACG